MYFRKEGYILAKRVMSGFFAISKKKGKQYMILTGLSIMIK
ncbi:hypothetical protein [Aneurinibacillus thermoaerophilus]|nr:hypothetical protein [Aneurinibacillus thermoaerophilus]